MSLSRAIQSIAIELFVRAPRNTSIDQIREYVGQNIISVPSNKPGHVHFMEYATKGE